MHLLREELTAAIMAGGGSRRMGEDKAAIPVDGVPMLERVARAALDAGLPVIVVGRERPEWWTLDAVRFVPDDYPGAGPLGGLATAFRATQGPVLLLGCDMPLLTTEAIRWLIEQAEHTVAPDGLVTTDGEHGEPLFSIYYPPSISSIESLILQQKWGMKDLLAIGTFASSQLPNSIRNCVLNVNTPEEVASIRKGARR